MDDNEAIDVLYELGGKQHGIEVKTMVDNKNARLRMHKSAMDRKADWEKPRKRTIHTIVFDDQACIPGKNIDEKIKSLEYVLRTGDESKIDFSKRRIFYRRGYGNFSVYSMHEVTGGAEEIKKLLGSTLRQLPERAR